MKLLYGVDLPSPNKTGAAPVDVPLNKCHTSTVYVDNDEVKLVANP